MLIDGDAHYEMLGGTFGERSVRVPEEIHFIDKVRTRRPCATAPRRRLIVVARGDVGFVRYTDLATSRQGVRYRPPPIVLVY